MAVLTPRIRTLTAMAVAIVLQAATMAIPSPIGAGQDASSGDVDRALFLAKELEGYGVQEDLFLRCGTALATARDALDAGRSGPAKAVRGRMQGAGEEISVIRQRVVAFRAQMVRLAQPGYETPRFLSWAGKMVQLSDSLGAVMESLKAGEKATPSP